VGAIQAALAGRASIRVDANRAYSEPDASRFASSLDPAGIELFEQPCDSEDWGANARVAAVSRVPLMLDEPICDLADIDRAGGIEGVGFCKLKLKRFGGLDRLIEALNRVRARGLEPVLGDGLSSEIGCWMEACAARSTICNAGEFNGFLKPKARLFADPLPCRSGELILRQGFSPVIDDGVLKAHEIASERFAATTVGIA
jgi:L-alanine-DL-glutamate epimerase-like enolase superfamily enzyme